MLGARATRAQAATELARRTTALSKSKISAREMIARSERISRRALKIYAFLYGLPALTNMFLCSLLLGTAGRRGGYPESSDERSMTDRAIRDISSRNMHAGSSMN